MESKSNHRPLVSIITPFLNTARFLEECIESVIHQTYDNWELLLVDDGSSDGSSEIARNYAANYPGKIYWLEHENHQNRGASASRNLGIQSSKGEYIAFLDSDDIYLPAKLDVQVPLLTAHPEAGMLYASTEYWYSWTGQPQDVQKDWVWEHFGVQPDTLIRPPQLLTTFLRDGGTVPCMGSVLVRRQAIESVGGWENVFKYIYTDQVFHTKICLNWPVLVCSGCWDRYRQHPDSSCHMVEKTNKAYVARYNYLTWLEKYLTEQQAHTNTELWEAYKNEMWPFRHQYLNKIVVFKNRVLKRVRKKLDLLKI
ncbi:glycosyltransferase family 2 protein [Botryobacter ruber]|uniref:glycosyltransferase family 2 protein n=1 Tax=Botryobacter ruber TaxID=2171629 RepID=UPI000E0A94B4|nr:glycosyltransferase family 2 protein [Botryobacter ruber]